MSVMPKNIQCSGQFLIYNYVEGDIVYNQLTPKLLTDLLHWAKNNLWIHKQSDTANVKCENFYFKKTYDRLNQFRVKYKNWSEPRVVNGQTVHNIEHYLENIDWNNLCNNTQWGFIHGDFQFENIIYNPNDKKFTCIDWRNDFSGDVYGDIYYDLGKMLGGILLNYQSVKNNDLQYEEKIDDVMLNDCSVNGSDIYITMVKNFCIENNLNWNKVRLLIPIIYLNMSPLHETPFDKYLFALAQLHFERYFNGY
jgi:thiamine kinase-like enzyme